eukprot:NODE_728_length_4389_cov_0.864569.p2 type:complete len:218 gc:universal NODE_728_length_4389_cov_0.864569:3363-4016(+)
MTNFDSLASKDLGFGLELGITPKDIDDVATSSLKGVKDLHLSEKRISVLTTNQKLSVLPAVLSNIKVALEKATQSCSALISKSPSPFDTPNDFAQIWCFIEFVYALPAIGQTLAHRQISGDGVIWAGCTFMALLDFPEKHNLCSFLYHLLYTRSIELYKEVTSSTLPDETEGVITMAAYIKHTNDQIYDFLNLNFKGDFDKQILFDVPNKREFEDKK